MKILGQWLLIASVALLLCYGCTKTVSKTAIFMYLNGYYDGCSETVDKMCNSIYEFDIEESMRCQALQKNLCEEQLQRKKDGKR